MTCSPGPPTNEWREKCLRVIITESTTRKLSKRSPRNEPKKSPSLKIYRAQRSDTSRFFCCCVSEPLSLYTSVGSVIRKPQNSVAIMAFAYLKTNYC